MTSMACSLPLTEHPMFKKQQRLTEENIWAQTISGHLFNLFFVIFSLKMQHSDMVALLYSVSHQRVCQILTQ